MSAEKRKEIAEKIRKEVRDIYEYASDIQDERCDFNLRRDQLDYLDDVLDDIVATTQIINGLLDQLDDWRDTE